MTLEDLKLFDTNGFLIDENGDYDDVHRTIEIRAQEIFRSTAALRLSTERGGLFRAYCNTVDNADLQFIPEGADGEEDEDESGKEKTTPYLYDEDIVCDCVLGDIWPLNLKQWQQSAMDMASTMLSRYEHQAQHTSWLTRRENPDGALAIITKKYVMVCLGCSPEYCDALLICLGFITGLLSQTDAKYLVAISGNELYPKMLEIVSRTMT